MKMEMAVQSQVTGVVRATHVAVGDKIDPEDLLVEVEEEEQQWDMGAYCQVDRDYCGDCLPIIGPRSTFDW